MQRVLAGIVFAASIATGAQAAGPASCEHRDIILQYSDFLLSKPSDGKPIYQRPGESAPYLEMIYRDMDGAARRAFIEPLNAERPRPAGAKSLTVVVSDTETRRQYILGQIKERGPVEGILFLADHSIYRTLLLDDTDWFLDRLGEIGPDQIMALELWPSLAFAVEDLDDAALDGLARKAEARKLWGLTLRLYASKSSLADLLAFVDRAPPEFLQYNGEPLDVGKQKWIEAALQTWAVRLQGSDLTKQPAAIQALVPEPEGIALRLAVVTLVGWRPEAAILMKLAASDGNFARTGEIAMRLLAAIASGELKPDREPDKFAHMLMDAIDKTIGREQRLALLGENKLSIQQTARDEALPWFDEAIASDVLAASVADPRQSMPDRPTLLSPGFDWKRWADTASALRGKTPVASADHIVAARILAGAGLFSEALEQLKTYHEPRDARVAASGIVLRLDDRCGDWFRPASLFGAGIYRFPPSPRPK